MPDLLYSSAKCTRKLFNDWIIQKSASKPFSPATMTLLQQYSWADSWYSLQLVFISRKVVYKAARRKPTVKSGSFICSCKTPPRQTWQRRPHDSTAGADGEDLPRRETFPRTHSQWRNVHQSWWLASKKRVTLSVLRHPVTEHDLLLTPAVCQLFSLTHRGLGSVSSDTSCYYSGVLRAHRDVNSLSVTDCLWKKYAFQQ